MDVALLLSEAQMRRIECHLRPTAKRRRPLFGLCHKRYFSVHIVCGALRATQRPHATQLSFFCDRWPIRDEAGAADCGG